MSSMNTTESGVEALREASTDTDDVGVLHGDLTSDRGDFGDGTQTLRLVHRLGHEPPRCRLRRTYLLHSLSLSLLVCVHGE